MPERTVRVADPAGLHARPAAKLVKAAAAYAADVRIRRGDREANAKSIVQVLTLDVGQGAEITLICGGDDAEQALDDLCALVGGEAPKMLSG
jgi:phosphotransferase system HPr (HPr) family protein